MRFTLFIAFLFCFDRSVNAQDSLNIETWNIYMRPRLVMHDDQIERAKEIVKTVLQDSIDILVFQELFDRKARKIISNGLKGMYQYSAGPGNKGLLRLNSGVVIFSKYPIKKNAIAYFSECKSSDCLAKKAVVFTQIEINEKKKLNLLGTHFQAIGGPVYRKIRKTQIEEMKSLADKNHQENVPVVFAGDFNISDSDSLFQNLLSSFKVKANNLSGKLKHSSSVGNTYRQESTSGSFIDHIFINENGASIKVKKYEIVRRTYLKNGIVNDMSDHYAVRAQIVY